MAFVDEDEAALAGFSGFVDVAGLLRTRCADVPRSAGVYLLFAAADQPAVLHVNAAGHYKGRDPTVASEYLEVRLRTGSRLLYIGQAGGSGSAATLRQRLDTFVRFGSGEAIAHWGGRCVWQLDASMTHRIAWMCPGEDARQVERSLIAAFETRFGMLPFANLRR